MEAVSFLCGKTRRRNSWSTLSKSNAMQLRNIFNSLRKFTGRIGQHRSLICLQCDSSIDQAGMLKITRREFKVKSSLTSSDGSTNNQTTHHHYERNICSTNQFRRGRTTWHCPSPAALAESLSGGER